MLLGRWGFPQRRGLCRLGCGWPGGPAPAISRGCRCNMAAECIQGSGAGPGSASRLPAAGASREALFGPFMVPVTLVRWPNETCCFERLRLTVTVTLGGISASTQGHSPSSVSTHLSHTPDTCVILFFSQVEQHDFYIDLDVFGGLPRMRET